MSTVHALAISVSRYWTAHTKFDLLCGLLVRCYSASWLIHTLQLPTPLETDMISLRHSLVIVSLPSLFLSAFFTWNPAGVVDSDILRFLKCHYRLHRSQSGCSIERRVCSLSATIWDTVWPFSRFMLTISLIALTRWKVVLVHMGSQLYNLISYQEWIIIQSCFRNWYWNWNRVYA